MEIVIGWLLFSVVVGFLGSQRKVGFWSALIWSLFLSPIIGIVVVVMSKRKDYKEDWNCEYCQLENDGRNIFCEGCDKDSKGNNKEDYKTLVNDPEYQEKLRLEKLAKLSRRNIFKKIELVIWCIVCGIALFYIIFKYI